MCPICKKDGLKILYEQTIDGQNVKICKICNAALKNKARAAAASAAAAVAEEAPAADAE